MRFLLKFYLIKMLMWIVFFLLISVCVTIIFLYYKRKRVIVIPDEESGNVIYNFYIADRIVNSIMKNSQGIKIYEVKYHRGIIFLTKSYDDLGNLIILQSYYTNGQVRNRIEYRYMKGKYKRNKIRFDIKGNKLL